MTRPDQQHLGHPEGGTWCGNGQRPSEAVAALRPRVPVCAACHIKAMHDRAERQAWAGVRLEAVVRAARTGTPTNPHAWAEGYAEAMAHILNALETVSWDEFLAHLAAPHAARRAQDVEGGATP